jgi:hypothetical protein
LSVLCRLARTRGKHGHNGSSPFDYGCEKRRERIVQSTMPVVRVLAYRRVID